MKKTFQDFLGIMEGWDRAGTHAGFIREIEKLVKLSGKRLQVLRFGPGEKASARLNGEDVDIISWKDGMIRISDMGSGAAGVGNVEMLAKAIKGDTRASENVEE